MRRVGRHVSEERLSLLHASTDEFVPLFEEDIGAETLGPYDPFVVKVSPVEVGVVPNVRGLPHAPAPVAIDLGKATILRAVG